MTVCGLVWNRCIWLFVSGFLQWCSYLCNHVLIYQYPTDIRSRGSVIQNPLPQTVCSSVAQLPGNQWWLPVYYSQGDVWEPESGVRSVFEVVESLIQGVSFRLVFHFFSHPTSCLNICSSCVGIYQYSHDFLLQLRYSPDACVCPVDLPQIPGVTDNTPGTVILQKAKHSHQFFSHFHNLISIWKWFESLNFLCYCVQMLQRETSLILEGQFTYIFHLKVSAYCQNSVRC